MVEHAEGLSSLDDIAQRLFEFGPEREIEGQQ